MCMKVVTIMQPGYLPWIGFFELMCRADIFIVYDNVEFDKNGWRNRNRIKTPSGPSWLTVPVHSSGKPKLCEVMINNKQDWRKKHLKSIEFNYRRSQYFEQYFSGVNELLGRDWQYLNDLNIAFIEYLSQAFDIKTKVILASSISERDKIEKMGKVEKLIEICKLFKGDIFYEAAGGKNYLLPEMEKFKKEGIEVVFQDIIPSPYRQLFGDFTPNLSALDLLFNEGGEGRDIIIKSGENIIIK